MSEPLPFVDIAAQTHAYREELDAAVARVLDHGRFILGPEVGELEEKLAAMVGAARCVTCGNGTDALVLALQALGVGDGDEVIVPAFSFGASAEVIALAGARPVFADIDPETFCLDVDACAAAIGERTRAVLAVSLFGLPAQMGALAELCRERGLHLVEDAAQSMGAEQGGRCSGSLADVTTTSFFPAKPLGAFGDGGAIFTDRAELADHIRTLRAHGQTERNRHTIVGTNSRLDTLQAALLLVKLRHFDDELAARRVAAARYDALLADAPLRTPFVPADARSAWAQYTVRLDAAVAPQRAAIRQRLGERGVPTAVYYTMTLDEQPAYAPYHDGRPLPVAKSCTADVLSLPISAFIEEAQQQRVVSELLEAIAALS